MPEPFASKQPVYKFVRPNLHPRQMSLRRHNKSQAGIIKKKPLYDIIRTIQTTPIFWLQFFFSRLWITLVRPISKRQMPSLNQWSHNHRFADPKDMVGGGDAVGNSEAHVTPPPLAWFREHDRSPSGLLPWKAGRHHWSINILKTISRLVPVVARLLENRAAPFGALVHI